MEWALVFLTSATVIFASILQTPTPLSPQWLLRTCKSWGRWDCAASTDRSDGAVRAGMEMICKTIGSENSSTPLMSAHMIVTGLDLCERCAHKGRAPCIVPTQGNPTQKHGQFWIPEQMLRRRFTLRRNLRDRRRSVTTVCEPKFSAVRLKS